MSEKRYTLNQQISTNNKGDLASYIDGIYDWYNNEKLDWYEVVDRLNEQDEQMQELEEMNTHLCNFNLHNILDKKNNEIKQLKQENKRMTNKLNELALEFLNHEMISMGKATEISEMCYHDFLKYRKDNGNPMELQL